MKKSTKRLSVTVETVRNLHAIELAEVAAGATPGTVLQNGRGYSCKNADPGCNGLIGFNPII